MRRPRRIPYDAWLDNSNGSNSIECQDVAMVEIHMPADRFRALLEHDAWLERAGLHDNQYFTNNVGRVANMVVEHERECCLRHEHPSLQSAWEQYQVLLKMLS